MKVNVTAGSEAGGDPIISYDKPCGCPVSFSIPTDNGEIDCPCCCFLPEMSSTIDGSEVKSKYICDQYCCVSKFMYSENGKDVTWCSRTPAAEVVAQLAGVHAESQ